MASSAAEPVTRYGQLASALAVLDQEIVLPGRSRHISGSAKRWTARVLALAQDPPKHTLKELLDETWTPGQFLFGDEHTTRDCWELLDTALRRVGDVVRGPESQSAGAVYLYDWLHDELVMAASRGFPLKTGPDVTDPLLKIGGKCGEEVRRSLTKLRYISKTLGPRIAREQVARHPWVSDELRLPVEPDGAGSLVGLDCNQELVGIAYYRPGSGITGRLFDPKQGTELERPAFAGAGKRDFVDKCKDGVSRLLGEPPTPDPGVVCKHLQDELLLRRTVVYGARDEMAIGRQVKAGTYEPLQFPDSQLIGPFMGAVLRFGGEHLGILKVERHRFDEAKLPFADDRTGTWPEEWPKDRAREVPSFTEEEVAGFVVFTYCLAGVLYVMKHHLGVELSDAWTCRPAPGSQEVT